MSTWSNFSFFEKVCIIKFESFSPYNTKSFDAAQNKDHKCNEMHNKILCYYHDIHRPVIRS